MYNMEKALNFITTLTSFSVNCSCNSMRHWIFVIICSALFNLLFFPCCNKQLRSAVNGRCSFFENRFLSRRFISNRKFSIGLTFCELGGPESCTELHSSCSFLHFFFLFSFFFFSSSHLLVPTTRRICFKVSSNKCPKFCFCLDTYFLFLCI